MKKDYKIAFVKNRAAFGNHVFRMSDQLNANLLYDVTHIEYNEKWNTPSKNALVNEVAGPLDFKSFVNECHSVYLSGLGSYN